MSTKQKEKLIPIISAAAAVIIFLALLLMPTAQGLTPEAQKSMALFAFALVMWIARPIPIYQTSIIPKHPHRCSSSLSR